MKTPLFCSMILAGLLTASNTVQAQLFPALPGACPINPVLADNFPYDTVPQSAFYFPAQPAGSVDERVPFSATVWRTPCAQSPETTRLTIRISNFSGNSTRPFLRVQVTQAGVNLGCFGVGCTAFFDPSINPATGISTPMAWTETGVIFNLRASQANIPFDPDAAFNLDFVLSTASGERVIRHAVPAKGAPGTLPALRSDIAGMWWSPTDPGWAVSIERNERGVVFASWLTFDEQGQSTWFVMPQGLHTGTNKIVGDVYAPSGPAFGSGLTASLDVGPVIGSFMLDFSDANQARFSFDIDGKRGTHQLEKLTVPPANGQACSGSQVQLASQAMPSLGIGASVIQGWAATLTGGSPWCNRHATLITYNDAGKPRWFFAGLQATPTGRARSLVEYPPIKLEGDIYAPTGTPWFAAPGTRVFQIGPAVGTWLLQPDSQVHQLIIDGKSMSLSFKPFKFEY